MAIFDVLRFMAIYYYESSGDIDTQAYGPLQKVMR